MTTTPTTDAQRQEQIEALIDSSHRQAQQIDKLFDALERLAGVAVRARQEAEDADNRARRAEDAARDAGYAADDAKRTADDAARRTARGW